MSRDALIAVLSLPVYTNTERATDGAASLNRNKICCVKALFCSRAVAGERRL